MIDVVVAATIFLVLLAMPRSNPVTRWWSLHVWRPLCAKARCYNCGRKTSHPAIPCWECYSAAVEAGTDLELIARRPKADVSDAAADTPPPP